MVRSKYDLIPSSDNEFLNDHQLPFNIHANRRRLGSWYTFVLAALFTSVLSNLFLLYKVNYRHNDIGPISRSRYAGLVNDLDIPYRWNTPFSGENYTEVNKLWYEDEEANEGIIALDYDYALGFGLPKSQPFPWDGKKKGIYITNGHHNLHCLRNIYISLDQYRTNTPQTLEWGHVLHCLDNLREDILCNADDTPRFTQAGEKPGNGQLRRCRDWSQLQKYVRQHAGCFKYIHPEDPKFPTMERMKYCPNDSPYLPLIRKYFGLPDSWLPWPAKENVD